MRTGIVYDPVFLKHQTGEHVENSDRLITVISHLEQTQTMVRLTPISAQPATIDQLGLVHYKTHIERVRSSCLSGRSWIDSDTCVSAGSFEAAAWAVGGAILAAEAVLDEEVENSFALVRPPGHHATPTEAMGFCLFNNVAIAAKHIADKYGLERIAIVDFDVHHCNGTQMVFESDPGILCISIHQSPLYPGTGKVEDTGSGKAIGTKVNIPLPPGSGDTEYRLAFERIVVPAVNRFRPQIILVSAGYDSHWLDSISAMQVSVSGFIQIMRIIKRLAEECGNRLALVLEGGYDANALSSSIKATFEVLLGDSDIEDPLGPSPYRRKEGLLLDTDRLIQHIREVHSLP